jgi:hypothetical protein
VFALAMVNMYGENALLAAVIANAHIKSFFDGCPRMTFTCQYDADGSIIGQAKKGACAGKHMHTMCQVHHARTGS